MALWPATIGIAADPPPEIETPTAEVADPNPASAEQIAKWIKDLDGDQFAVRREATRRLAAAGKAAIEPVAKAAEGESLEVTSRAIEVLGRLFQSSDPETKAAAEAALEKLSGSDNRSAARRAADVLRPKQAEADEAAAQPAIPNFPGFRFQFPQQFGRAMAMRQQVNNGVRQIDIDEDGKKIHIEESAEKGIKITVTAKVEGKEKTATYAAKNEEELKKNHPAGHALYQKYAAAQPAAVLGNIQIMVNGQMVPIPLQGAALPQPGLTDDQKKAVAQLAAAQAELKAVHEKLKQLAQTGADADSLTQLAAELQAATEKIAEANKQLAP